MRKFNKSLQANLRNGCIFYINIKTMKAKAAQKQHKDKMRQISSLRNKTSKRRPIANIDDQDSPLFHTLTLNRQIQQVKILNTYSKQQQLTFEDEFLVPQTNKIYNKTAKASQISTFGGITGKQNAKASLKDLTKSNYECANQSEECRPKTSHLNKIQLNAQIFRNNNDVLNYQNRPGSSKSSRLFKRKGVLANDTINTQNEESEALIRVTSIGGSRNKNIKTATGVRNRVGTSLNHSKGVDAVPAKLDPAFYRLFAK